VSGTAWRSRTDPALTDLDWRQGDQIGAAITLVSSATIAASIFAIARLVFF